MDRLATTPAGQRLRQRRSPFSRAVGWIVDELQILHKYGRFRPGHLYLAGSGHRVFVDSADRRGRFLLRREPVFATHLKDLWRWAADAYAPTLVLDVGLNYGEFLFSPTYSSVRRAIGVEANPNLKPWNLRSRLDHPNADVIELHYVAATDASGIDTTIYVDKRSSGTSSMAIRRMSGRYTPVSIPAVTVDDLIDSDLTRKDRILFKVDVEGHEPSVLRGMEQTLDRCDSALGIVEFHPNHLARDSTSASEFYAVLCEQFDVYPWRVQDESAPDEAGITTLQGTMVLEAAVSKEVPMATDLVLALGSDAVAAVDAYRSQRASET